MKWSHPIFLKIHRSSGEVVTGGRYLLNSVQLVMKSVRSVNEGFLFRSIKSIKFSATVLRQGTGVAIVLNDFSTFSTFSSFFRSHLISCSHEPTAQLKCFILTFGTPTVLDYNSLTHRCGTVNMDSFTHALAVIRLLTFFYQKLATTLLAQLTIKHKS